MTAGSDICLPGTATDLIGKVLSQPDLHPALQLDKLSPATEKGQRRAIDAVCRCTGDGHLLKNLVERRRGMLAAFAAQRFSGKTAGALTLHLSRANALENVGLAFHPIYGFAFLPGSGLKGMTRAWAETVWKPDASDQQAAEARIEAAFGIQNAAGRIIFHDAWPVQWPQLEPDIVNCHHRDYYQQGKPPGDWENPVPVYFLTVAAGTQFEFTVSDRLQTADGLLEQVVDWMRLALEHAGIGAKTAAGYGRIVPCDTDSSDSVALPASCLRREHDLKLLSPAFLAGAKQERADCDLRPASLRGLLRWWWRTMHAHHMGSTDLAQFEALIWGDTQRGSAVSLSLTGAADNAGPVIYNRQTVEQNASPPKSGNRKTIQGLFYISWGMLPDNKQSGRHYRQPGDSWKLTLIARETFRPPTSGAGRVTIPADLVMRQAEAALWLLARFGGAGSKSRKGFGAFADIEVEGIGSLEDCIAAGRELRDVCKFTTQTGRKTKTPALESRIGPIKITTPWKDPWFALDRVGDVYQRFVKECKPADRAKLGLPRKGLPRDLNRPRRLASPVHWSLTHGEGGRLTVRWIAFPDGTNDTSTGILRALRGFAERDLAESVRRYRGSGQKTPQRGRTTLDQPLQPRQTIMAELIEEKTKKGGWKARHPETGITGHIENNNAVPPDAEVGQKVKLIVKIAKPNHTVFLWPTPGTEQMQRKATRKPPGGRRRW